MCKIFAIYPTDQQELTEFLNQIDDYLTEKLNNDWHCYKIGFNEEDHTNCLKQAKESSAKFILFMGHGKSNCLYGSCAKDASDFITPDAGYENEQYYKNEYFIHKDNIGSFCNKIFFSFSCNSNEKGTNSIGRKAIENGVLSFIGFGDIPTDYIKTNNFSKKAIDLFKGLITKIIKESLFLAIINNYKVYELVTLIKILADQEMQKLILFSNNRHKKVLVERLYAFKTDIEIMGNRYEPLIAGSK